MNDIFYSAMAPVTALIEAVWAPYLALFDNAVKDALSKFER